MTSTALSRRVPALEAELGVPIFEWLPRAVGLSTVGELPNQLIGTQTSDLERLKAPIADLAGERLGLVAIACSQTLRPDFLPERIAI